MLRCQLFLPVLIYRTYFSQGTAIRDRIQESLRGQKDYNSGSDDEGDFDDDDDDEDDDDEEYYYDDGDVNDEEKFYDSDAK